MSDQQPQPPVLSPFADAPMEYLDTAPLAEEAAPRRRRRWVPYVAGAVTFLIVVVALGLLIGDWASRNVEMRTLVSKIEASESAMEATQAAVKDAFAEYEGQGTLSDADRAALDEKLKLAAATGLAGVTSAGDDLGNVRILRWHSGVKVAQDAYLAHNKAWQAYLAKAAKDPAEFAVTQDQVNSTFAAAEQPMRDAIPAPDLFRLKERVDVIYAPPPADTSGPSQQA